MQQIAHHFQTRATMYPKTPGSLLCRIIVCLQIVHPVLHHLVVQFFLYNQVGPGRGAPEYHSMEESPCCCGRPGKVDSYQFL